MANQGIAPLDPETALGQARAMIGDVNYVASSPPLTGYGDYNYFSDAEILTFLVQGVLSPTRATGYAYLQLSAGYTISGESIRTDDLAIDDRFRGKDFLELAKFYFDRADAEDAAAAIADFSFEVITPERPCEYRYPF